MYCVFGIVFNISVISYADIEDSKLFINEMKAPSNFSTLRLLSLISFTSQAEISKYWIEKCCKKHDMNINRKRRMHKFEWYTEPYFEGCGDNSMSLHFHNLYSSEKCTFNVYSCNITEPTDAWNCAYKYQVQTCFCAHTYRVQFISFSLMKFCTLQSSQNPQNLNW